MPAELRSTSEGAADPVARAWRATRSAAAAAQLSLRLDERAKVDADYYRLGAGGERTFAGWAKWRGYVGLNEIRFGGRATHFRARPGRYVALAAGDRPLEQHQPSRASCASRSCLGAILDAPGFRKLRA